MNICLFCIVYLLKITVFMEDGYNNERKVVKGVGKVMHSGRVEKVEKGREGGGSQGRC